LARKINNLFHRQKISLIRKKKKITTREKENPSKARQKKKKKSTIPIRKNNTEDTNEYNFLI